MVVRLVDFLKGSGITAFFTNLIHSAGDAVATDVGISSIIDTWLLLREVEQAGSRDLTAQIIKSRGMAHSRRIHPLAITDRGVEIADAPA
jgi:circadian clock protein KaiC